MSAPYKAYMGPLTLNVTLNTNPMHTLPMNSSLTIATTLKSRIHDSCVDFGAV